jgi:hypothetical protein
MPFSLRGVRLIGVSGSGAHGVRELVWGKLAGAYRPRHLAQIAQVIGLDGLGAAAARMLEGRTRGRTVVRLLP